MPAIQAIKPWTFNYFIDEPAGVRSGDYIKSESGSVWVVIEVKDATRRKYRTEYVLLLQPLGRGAHVPPNAHLHIMGFFSNSDVHKERLAG